MSENNYVYGVFENEAGKYNFREFVWKFSGNLFRQESDANEWVDVLRKENNKNRLAGAPAMNYEVREICIQ